MLEDWPASISMDSRGRIALAIAGGKGLAVLYDSSGRSPMRIGRTGSGPNEYRWPAAVAFGAGDTLHVFDLSLSRRTKLVGNARGVATTPYRARSVLVRMLPNSEMVVLSNTRFQRYSQKGDLIKEWGQPFPPVPGGTRLPTRRMSNVVGDRYWAVNSETYELEEWNLQGQRLSQLSRVADWLDPNREFSNGMRGNEPTPDVADLRVDRSGHLMVLVNVPRKSWRAGLGTAETRRGFTSYPNMDFGLVFDTLIEVYDTHTRKLVQVTRAPAYLRFFVSDSHVAGLRHSGDGSPVVDLWRVVITIP